MSDNRYYVGWLDRLMFWLVFFPFGLFILALGSVRKWIGPGG